MPAQPSDADLRTAIVGHAVELFASRGYHQTTLDDIAAELGVTKGAIYYHFPRKSEILQVIHDEFITVLADRVHSRQGFDIDAPSELQLVIRDIMWLMEYMQDHVRVFFEEVRELDPHSRSQVRRKRQAYEEHVRRTYERGVQQGSLRPFSPQIPTMALFGMVNWSYHWFRAEAPDTHRAVAAILADLFLGGVSAPPCGLHTWVIRTGPPPGARVAQRAHDMRYQSYCNETVED